MTRRHLWTRGATFFYFDMKVWYLGQISEHPLMTQVGQCSLFSLVAGESWHQGVSSALLDGRSWHRLFDPRWGAR